MLARCTALGFDSSDRQDDGSQEKAWLEANLAEVQLVMPFVESHVALLHKCLMQRADASKKEALNDRWRQIGIGPQSIEDIERAAENMNKSRSHLGLSPEAVLAGGDNVKTAMLHLTRYYYSGD